MNSSPFSNSSEGQAGFEIIPATWRDTLAIHQLEKVCFPLDAWPLLDVLASLSLPNLARFKALVGGRLAGFVAIDNKPEEDLAWIATVGVLPEYRNRGIARELILRGEQSVHVSRMRLCVRISNEQAIALYKKLGYRSAGAWSGYYNGGEDALIMEKKLV